MKRRIKGMNRRQFLQTSGLTAAGAAAVVPLLTVAGGSRAIELSGALDQHAADTLLAMVRQLYPHDTLSDIYYAVVVEDLDVAAKSDAAMAKLLQDGVVALDDAMRVNFLNLSDGYQAKVLESMQDTPFFQKVRSTTVVSLYNQELVWRHFGYEGASYPYGGYIDRGFDDLSWLPEPPAEASPPKRG